jgi:DNA-binding winged helix-turn-helix (wHTH) protein
MSEGVFRFGRCEVRVASKEVFFEGREQSLAPKPFDVLVYLIEHRKRTVSKDELLDRLWPSEFVSPTVVASVIVKVRQAIGDRSKVSPLIKTAHGEGYRFTGVLQDDGIPSGEPGIAHGAMQTSPTAQLPVSLALLPFRNLTGQAATDWVELGLMSLVVKALSTDRRLSVTPIQLLLNALEALPREAQPRERAARVQRRLGVHYVVQVVVGREDRQYYLDCSIGNAAKIERARLYGPELTRLGQRLARQLESMLFPDSSAVPLAFDSADPLANRALARAMQAVGEQKWTEALNLLQVVLDIEQDNETVLLEKLRVLAALDDSEAFRLGDQLLARAHATANNRLAAEVHLAMGCHAPT